MRSHIAILLLAALAIGLTACAAGVRDAPSVPAEPTRSVRDAPDLATLPPSDAPGTGEVPAQLLAAVKADAAERSGVEPEAVVVVSAEAVTWNDGSLGCPEPGMSYTMALVDGYHVILAADDEELDYRLTANGGYSLCENGGRPSG